MKSADSFMDFCRELIKKREALNSRNLSTILNEIKELVQTSYLSLLAKEEESVRIRLAYFPSSPKGSKILVAADNFFFRFKDQVTPDSDLLSQDDKIGSASGAAKLTTQLRGENKLQCADGEMLDFGRSSLYSSDGSVVNSLGVTQEEIKFFDGPLYFLYDELSTKAPTWARRKYKALDPDYLRFKSQAVIYRGNLHKNCHLI